MSVPYVNTRTWVWSDTHLGHANIIKFQQRPLNHEVIMLSEWARLVRDEDTILHLGDVFMGRQGNPKRWANIIRRMPGRKMLILGNHDGHGHLYAEAGFEIVEPFVSEVKGTRIAFTHRPMSGVYRGQPEHAFAGTGWCGPELNDWDMNVHGHVHLNGYRPADGDIFQDRRYVNVSVEAIDFHPRQVGGLL